MDDAATLADLIERYKEFRTKFEVSLDLERRREMWVELKLAYDALLKVAPDQVEPLPPHP